MTIIFPMAGLSSRFFKAGYKIPKYMFPINDNTLFYEVVNGFNKYFDDCNFLFICKKDYDTKDFIVKECEKLNLKTYTIIELDFDTLGQAHTVYLGLEKANVKDEILIFNIDTIRPNFQLPNEEFLTNCDGYLEVFETDGDNWSFILPSTNNLVLKTTEKERISSLCSSGLYYFKNSEDIIKIFQTMLDKKETSKNEYYIAPIYNYLIRDKKIIKYYQIKQNEIIPCGTPDEYEKIIEKGNIMKINDIINDFKTYRINISTKINANYKVNININKNSNWQGLINKMSWLNENERIGIYVQNNVHSGQLVINCTDKCD